jgi:hypothetical protein
MVYWLRSEASDAIDQRAPLHPALKLVSGETIFKGAAMALLGVTDTAAAAARAATAAAAQEGDSDDEGNAVRRRRRRRKCGWAQ